MRWDNNKQLIGGKSQKKNEEKKAAKSTYNRFESLFVCRLFNYINISIKQESQSDNKYI